ncbi:Uncharacterised protein [Vibrio cholerae]|nr:Uncharacterised protein [Vibrio cholerae]
MKNRPAATINTPRSAPNTTPRILSVPESPVFSTSWAIT